MPDFRWRHGACALSLSAAMAGCAHPAAPPAAAPQASLQPVAGDGWQTYEAVLAGDFKDPAAGYEGVYPTKKGRVKFRIEVRVPRYAGEDTVGPSLTQARPGRPPNDGAYIVARIYSASDRLPVTPVRILPRGPCGPAGTPESAVSVPVRTDAEGAKARVPLPPSPYKVAYTPIYVRFDADPGQLAGCSLDFTAAIGDGRLAIPPLRLVSEAGRADMRPIDAAAAATE